MSEALLPVPNEASAPVARAAGTNPAKVYLASLSPGSRPAMEQVLRLVAERAGYTVETMPWARLRYQHLQALRASWLEEGLAPATINKRLSALRGVLREAWRMGMISAEDYRRAADVPNVEGKRLPAGRSVTPGELAALMAACADGTAVGIRDAAIIAVAYAGGLRRAELAALRREDVERVGEGTFRLRVRGKRNKHRMIFLDNGAAQALEAYLSIRGDWDGPLFVRAYKGGRLSTTGMTPQTVRLVLQRRAAAAGVAHVSPHDLRRSCVSDMLDAGVDAVTVANHVGHASVETTRRYDRRGERALQQAARSLHVPFFGGPLVK
ncbi:integrase (plasmid) [Thermaerobacter sp. FW80]|uniref:tyrosine-type recombinase/integrase n=1 Tax=Thermaerobacter sp. FW80 TaxID=2546351 RepID=UPI0010752EC4|nr:tyrosine-type recombinase/integrase [Thermaerobacter sp. FW80]QBS38738.1 integrase [Thermaerobacter sp. FW80]